MAHQGYGFCEFLTEEDAEYACKIMNQIKLWGKPIRVNKVRIKYTINYLGLHVFPYKVSSSSSSLFFCLFASIYTLSLIGIRAFPTSSYIVKLTIIKRLAHGFLTSKPIFSKKESLYPFLLLCAPSMASISHFQVRLVHRLHLTLSMSDDFMIYKQVKVYWGQAMQQVFKILLLKLILCESM